MKKDGNFMIKNLYQFLPLTSNTGSSLFTFPWCQRFNNNNFLVLCELNYHLFYFESFIFDQKVFFGFYDQRFSYSCRVVMTSWRLVVNVLSASTCPIIPIFAFVLSLLNLQVYPQ
ncbi:hypothetical protein RF11_12503 [Thelohanellus kitauei]|uniref:Uncharacterized protein n=1 Tax=Thelohanellus kitauei TaxID=669202 RepID=A0A0C2N0R7_THEKT|nr:hypothetical protein RF11_12503 [Thelohanellus kitauei]